MIIELVRKEFIKQRDSLSQSKWARFIKLMVKMLFAAAFVALECFVFLSLDKKINAYSSYGSFDFLVLYSYIVMMVAIAMVTIKARKTLFSHDDSRIVLALPITKEEIVISKAIYVYLYSCLYMLLLHTPILVCYGTTKLVYSYYYIFSFIFPMIISFFIVGVALVFAPFVELFYRSIKFSDLLQFVLASILVIGACFAYQFALKVFLTALSDSSIGGVFSKEFVEGLHHSVKFLFPMVHILNPILNTDVNNVRNVLLFVGELLIAASLGFFVSSYFYRLFVNKNIQVKITNKKANTLKVVSPTKALFKKEFMMLFKDNSYIFSYTALLILAPFLSFLVISSLNEIIYKNLEFFSVYFPELVNGLNITLILLFLTVINSSAALSMSREGKMIQIVKYIPVSPLRQIMIKLITPMCLSMISLLVTLITLFASGSIKPVVFGISLLLGVIILFADNVLSMEWDMHDKGANKYKLANLNVLLALGFPILILFFHFLLSFLYCPSWAIYLVEAILGLLLLLPCFIKIKSRYIKAFKGMEV